MVGRFVSIFVAAKVNRNLFVILNNLVYLSEMEYTIYGYLASI